MIKKIFIITALILLSTYLLLAMTVFNSNPKNLECQGIVMNVMDDVDYGFFTDKDLNKILSANKLNPEKKPFDKIDTRKMEETLAKNPLIRDVECYVTLGGKIGIDIYQRIPIIRVMNNKGENYYLDNEGEIMTIRNKPTHVAIATGYISKDFAQRELFRLAQFIHQDEFWEAQTEQVNITSKGEIEIIPRVGNHVLFLGKAQDLEKKFSKLRTFYEKAFSHVGWNKYKRISVEFNNQIICTKKGEK